MQNSDYDAILHIGAGKTGSSAIQTFIRENHIWLRRQGVAVPNAHFRFAENIGGHHVFACQEFFNAGGVGFYHRLNHMMAQRPSRTVLLSAENISNGGNETFFKRFCSEYKTKVIFYIRRQDEFLASAWQQWNAKTRSDIDGWLKEATTNLAHWDKTIAAWEGVVGQGNVVPRVFERKRLPEGNVVLDFLHALDIGWNGDKSGLNFEGGEVNQSYDNVITSIFAGRRDLFENAHDDKFYQFIVESSGGKFRGTGNLSLISREWREKIISHYEPGNTAIKERFFPDEASLFMPLDHAKYRYAEDIDLAQAQRKALIDIVSSLYLSQKP
jgi:hypothetical protein